jgi:hypothetical protein
MSERPNLIDQVGWDNWFQIVVWPLSVCQVGLLIAELKAQIRKKGGQRQRSEGIKLLNRIHDRQHEQLLDNSQRIKANKTGWKI